MFKNFCGSPDHAISRRGFLGAAAVGAAAAADMTQLNVLGTPALAGEMKKGQKRVIMLWLAGGSSQLETWDPKPGQITGGPFRAIQTDVPGLHISELMPQMAKRMKATTISIDASHVSMLSKPKDVSKVILDAAAASERTAKR